MAEPKGNRSFVARRQQATVFGDLRGIDEAFAALMDPPVGRPPAPAEGQFPARVADILGTQNTQDTKTIDNTSQFNWKVFGLVSTGVAFAIGFILLLKTKENDYA